MNIQQALATAVEYLEQNRESDRGRDAETLLMHVLGCDRAHVMAHPERELTAAQAEDFEDVVVKRARGVPLQYITGHQEFWGLDFVVTPAVLIPRPQTEHVVEAALAIAQEHYAECGDGALQLLDVGTGAGTIALALAHSLPKARVLATEISEPALEIARLNGERLGLAGRVQFQQADLLTGIAASSVDIVAGNPPYIGRKETLGVQRQVREHEPDVALFGGESGMEVFEKLLPQMHEVLRPRGWFALEMGYTQEAPMRALIAADGRWTDVKIVPDLQGIPRVAVARRG